MSTAFPRAWAHNQVRSAVVKGVLPPQSGQKCTDCGNQATDYDHRDYNKPFDVEPVCRKCNLLRGSAVPLKGQYMDDIEFQIDQSVIDEAKKDLKDMLKAMGYKKVKTPPTFVRVKK